MCRATGRIHFSNNGLWNVFHTFDFSITRYLNTKIFTHLRFDKSRPRDIDWKYWQFKEILSFGIVYRFATSE